MSYLVAAPVLIPMLAGALSLVAWRSHMLQRALAVLGTGALLISAILLMIEVANEGIQVTEFGGWPAPMGIVFVADWLSVLMVLLTGITGLAAAIFSLPGTTLRMEHAGYYALLHVLLAGVAGAFLTGDVFNLYVWFEIMLLASFALLAMGGERAQMAGALKYVVLNLISSAIFLTAIGLLYGLIGTLNMADVAVKVAALESSDRVTVIATLFMIAFGIKAAAFPLFFWLPASYHTPPVAVSALFAGLLTKVGVYALYRFFTLIFTADVGFTHEVLKWVAVFTMLSGVLGAAAQFEFRRILSFHIISQIGYMILGLALYTPLAVAGGVFYLAHHIIVKANLFFISGATYHLRGSHDLSRLGGLWKTHPWLGVLFLIPALSLAGVPPLSGFWAKFIVIKAGVALDEWLVVAAALLTGLLTLYSMMKIWMEVFWKATPPETAELRGVRPPAAMTMVIVALSVLTVLIGVIAEPVWQLAAAAADQLLDPRAYIEAVLPESAQ
ncbi:Na+/H+ antiporter subunit D [Algiphilus sp.]|uniref:Na+/H+ antiporter subunit D n=3 Tax=Algiphilus sp. TaxID=1872431 RepID=UPI001CA6AE9D|nr:Na+/H+ antiporter subunit D [Algiphilus sp.]MBY8964554.1 Na+/H+ antiporter subunit D [Algiphilus acroporae]MCI5063277.1 Na+/H+ antiporter subunit D [Algiphilus sp.]MCI5102338.1 Na+/H+ antiporter subunit D [Algiphilus sp.]